LADGQEIVGSGCLYNFFPHDRKAGGLPWRRGFIL
jgi:hypothetical protein